MALQFKAKVVDSTMELNWFAPTLVTALPFPGTREFANLVKDLEPYGPEASRMTVETPSKKLSDVAIRFGLRNGAVELSLFYTGFRILIAPFEKHHGADLGPLAMGTVNNLGFREILAPGGRFRVNYHCHLKLDYGTSLQLLRGLMSSSVDGFEPDGCSFVFTPPDRAGLESAKFLVERSLRVDEGLFIGCKLEFGVLQHLDILTERSTEIIGYAIDSIGIQLH